MIVHIDLTASVKRAPDVEFSEKDLAEVVASVFSKQFPSRIEAASKSALVVAGIPQASVVVTFANFGVRVEKGSNGKVGAEDAAPLPSAVSPSLPSSEPRLRVVP